MGKISKALEKAEKEKVVNPIRQTKTKDVKPDMETSQHSDKGRSILKSDYNNQPVSHQGITDIDFLSDKEPVEQNTQRSVVDPSKSAIKVTAHKVENLSVHDPNRSEDPTNISFLKPVSSETLHSKQPMNQQPKSKPIGGVNTIDSGRSDRKQVNVKYSRTKVQISDPEKLKNNRVLSLFEDIETANQFKMLRTQVMRKLKAAGGNSILVTSANPCEGKTFTSINLGISIAKEFDRTVLIVDADIRRPLKEHTDFATEFFSLRVEKGLADYLEGEADIEEILINPGIDKLTLIPGGMPVDNSPELLNSARMEMMMEEIKSRYPSDRLVILDGPAILHFPDAMILYKYVDGVLPVIESEKTSTEQVKKMMEYLHEVNILGVVLNKNRS